ncbi:MAG: Por secretion system protein [Paludibacteraceae bacterium]|nr:Por secretion system protein [Paludibacteraceae bacterium]
MKKLLLLPLLLLSLTVGAQDSLRLTAFPGAEGYGKFVTGGRGGNVYYVTRLDDCTDANLVEGTLRWALRSGDDTPRTILFKVCGTIYLTSKLKLQHPNVTIAGQSAPGGGICIAGCNIYVSKPNVIIRHIRFRAGDIPSSSYPALDMENTQNVIIDHCSFTWSMEECVTAYDTDSTTIQWSIIGEGLYNSKNKKGSRAYATQWGGEHSTMHHCLITNCLSRTPRFNGVRDDAQLNKGNHYHDAFVDSEFANNVIFNWGKPNSLYGGENDTTVNKDSLGIPVGYDHIYMVNNYFRCGPATLAAKMSSRYFVQGSKDRDYGRWYLSGNMFETGNKYNHTASVWTDANLQLVNDSNLYGFTESNSVRAFNLDGKSANQDTYDRYVLLEQYASSELNLETAAQAFASVCANAGATLPRLDEEDERLLAEAAGTRDPQFVGRTAPANLGIIDSQEDITFTCVDTFMVGNDTITSYPYLGMLEGDTIAVDTDGDGMPDAWETAHGLNPADAADGNLCTLSALNAGYTNLEFFLNDGDGELSAPIPAGRPVPKVETALPMSREDNTKVQYIMHEGTLYLLKNDEKYTLSGQLVK